MNIYENEVNKENLLCRSSLGNGNRDTQDGICTEVALVGRAISLDEEVINSLLLSDSNSRFDECRTKDFVDIVDSLADTFAKVSGFVSITEFYSLVDTSRGTAGNCSTESTCL